MPRLRVVLAALFAVGTVFVASPASACTPESEPCGPYPFPCAEKINNISQKLYGEDLIHCPW